ncbi:MAG: S24/S26 family peptidase [Sphingobacteriia bacterium]|nr:S24/S26 family peptidase [Sphingobacteriia bacterium]
MSDKKKEDKMQPVFNTIGDRITYLRDFFLNLNRQEFSKRFNISYRNLTKWESNNFNISDVSLKHLTSIFQANNIIVTEEWIKSGKGDIPKILKIGKPENSENSVKFNDSIKALYEAKEFESKYSDTIVTMVSSDAMMPFYQSGDYVGGVKYFFPNIYDAVNKDCIIVTEDGLKVFRRLVLSKDNKFRLLALNINCQVEPIIFEPQIKIAAPIIWHRKVVKS